MTTVLPFGKYRDRTLDELVRGTPEERGYVEWMAREFTNGPWRAAAETALEAYPLDRLAPGEAKLAIRVTLVSEMRIALQMPYHQRLATQLREHIDGVNWNRTTKQWECPLTQLARVLAVCEPFGTVTVDRLVAAAQAAERERRARLDAIRAQSDTSWEVPTLLPLFGFQNVGVEFVLAAGGRALVADEMGCGKTVQAIGASLVMRDQWEAGRILTLCPASLKINWRREWLKFAGLESTVWSGKKRDGSIDAPVHICNYDIFGKHRAQFEEMGIDVLIADECHYLKNKDAQRTQAVFGGGRGKARIAPFPAPYAILLSGTPVLNRPAELFSLLNYLAPDRFSDWYAYANRYGAWPPGNMQRRPSTPQNLDELHDRTKDLVIRRKKKDVIKDMPPKLVSDVFVDLSAVQRKGYTKLLGDVADEWSQAASEKRKPTLAELQELTAYLNACKLPKVREIIAELKEDENRAVLVFSTRLDPLRQLAAEYGDDAVYIDGSMKPEDRQLAVDRIQKGQASIALLSLRAAGVGLTLTRADTVIFLDQDFVPANHLQAEDRAHRIGQVNPVQIYYLLCTDTVDEDLRHLIERKLAITGQITDGEAVKVARQQSVFAEFVRRLKSRHKQFADVPELEAA